MWVYTSEFAGKDHNEIVSSRYSFLTFIYTTLNFYLVFCILLGRFLTLCMKTYYKAIVYHLIFFWKVLPVTLILLFFSFILYMHTRLFLSGAKKKSFKRKNSVGRKCCQLKVPKVLLIHLFVTLLINQTTGSDNRQFFL